MAEPFLPGGGVVRLVGAAPSAHHRLRHGGDAAESMRPPSRASASPIGGGGRPGPSGGPGARSDLGRHPRSRLKDELLFHARAYAIVLKRPDRRVLMLSKECRRARPHRRLDRDVGRSMAGRRLFDAVDRAAQNRVLRVVGDLPRDSRRHGRGGDRRNTAAPRHVRLFGAHPSSFDRHLADYRRRRLFQPAMAAGPPDAPHHRSMARFQEDPRTRRASSCRRPGPDEMGVAGASWRSCSATSGRPWCRRSAWPHSAPPWPRSTTTAQQPGHRHAWSTTAWPTSTTPRSRR